jgi:hypothetical protein
MNYIDNVRELTNSNCLIHNLVNSGFMEEDILLVNCSPEYSSRLTQLINHKSSFKNNNELYEQVNLDIPTKNKSQVYSFDDKEYQTFDRYLYNWANKYYQKDQKYLFITNTIFTGKKINKIRLTMKSKGVDHHNMMFISLYLHEDSILKPDLYSVKFNDSSIPVFFWENKN